jgi:mannose-6-phosphate isomerase-like protein (cupin superfamily)
MKLIALVPLLGALVMQSGTPAPGSVRIWTAKEMRSTAEALSKKLDAIKYAGEPQGTDGNRTFSIAHREGSGQAEIHDAVADILVITEGQITFVYGGTIVEGKTTAPGETRGSGITGGTEVTLGPGDIMHIPAKIPHQFKLSPGAKLTYFVAKVVQ